MKSSIESKRRNKDVWRSSPAGSTHGGEAEPGTQEFFERVLETRSLFEIPWLSELIPFSSFQNKQVLEIGCGAGYDAYELHRSGADYVGVDIVKENLGRTKDHLGLSQMFPKVVSADCEHLPFVAQSFEVVYSNGVLHHTDDIADSLKEISAVIRDRGELWITLYNKHSVFHWVTLFLFEHILLLGFWRLSFMQRLSMIEYTTSKELPVVRVYSVREVRKCLEAEGFKVRDMWVRKLTHQDLPGMMGLGKLWKLVPQRWWDVLGRAFGWYIVAHAEKVRM